MKKVLCPKGYIYVNAKMQKKCKVVLPCMRVDMIEHQAAFKDHEGNQILGDIPAPKHGIGKTFEEYNSNKEWLFFITQADWDKFLLESRLNKALKGKSNGTNN